MYQDKQKEAAKLICAELDKVSNWKFSIKILSKGYPHIVGKCTDGRKFETLIENFHNCAPEDLCANIVKLFGFDIMTPKDLYTNIMGLFGVDNTDYSWIGTFLIRHFVHVVLPVYNFGVCGLDHNTARFDMTMQDKKYTITHTVYANTMSDGAQPCSITLFPDSCFRKYHVLKHLSTALLLLLDPIEYFKKSDDLAEKYPEMKDCYEMGVFSMLLDYFSEMGLGIKHMTNARNLLTPETCELKELLLL